MTSHLPETEISDPSTWLHHWFTCLLCRSLKARLHFSVAELSDAKTTIKL